MSKRFFEPGDAVIFEPTGEKAIAEAKERGLYQWTGMVVHIKGVTYISDRYRYYQVEEFPSHLHVRNTAFRPVEGFDLQEMNDLLF